MILKTRMEEIRAIINTELDKLLPVPDTKDARVIEAMRYSSISTGKALRPFLVMTFGEILGIPKQTAIRIGVAIEMLHSYSLIHDDLPAMDNDTLRRGKPTNHVQFDEATAILAGDALQAKAFEILASLETSSNPAVRANLVLALAKAAGAEGMVAGQMIDLIGETQTLTLEEIKRMQSLKTGALLYFSCIAPAIVAQSDEATQKVISEFSEALGLMFQITDDILDVEGTEEMMGKTLGKDSEAHKSTFVSILGIEKARALAYNLEKRAQESIKTFGQKANILNDLLTFILERKH